MEKNYLKSIPPIKRGGINLSLKRSLINRKVRVPGTVIIYNLSISSGSNPSKSDHIIKSIDIYLSGGGMISK